MFLLLHIQVRAAHWSSTEKGKRLQSAKRAREKVHAQKERSMATETVSNILQHEQVTAGDVGNHTMKEHGEMEDDNNSMMNFMAEDEHDNDAKFLQNYSQQRHMDLEAFSCFSEARSAATGANCMNITGPYEFDPVPTGYNFHEEGRNQLRAALQELKLDLDLLHPQDAKQ